MCCYAVAAELAGLVFGRPKQHPIMLKEVCIGDLFNDSSEKAELCFHGLLDGDVVGKVVMVVCGDAASKTGVSGEELNP